MTIVGYAESAPSSLIGIQMDFSFDPATGAITIANLQQVYLPGSQVTVPIKVNDAGQIVGLYLDSGGKRMVFCSVKAITPQSTSRGPSPPRLWQSIIGRYRPLREIIPTLGAGFMDSSTAGGQFVPVNAGFATNLSVTGINDFGQMAGVYDLGGPLGTAQTFGFQGIAGFLTPLDYPNSVD